MTRASHGSGSKELTAFGGSRIANEIDRVRNNGLEAEGRIEKKGVTDVVRKASENSCWELLCSARDLCWCPRKVARDVVTGAGATDGCCLRGRECTEEF